VAIRGLFRAVHEAASDEAWPADEVGEAVGEVLRQVFLELADGVDAFGELVRVESRPGRGSATPQVHRVQAGLEGLHEARARLTELLLVDTDPLLLELHAAVLSTVRRLLREMSLEERVRRQLRLLPRSTRTRPPYPPGRQGAGRDPHGEPERDSGPDEPTQLM
jgi:hypothetical protein